MTTTAIVSVNYDKLAGMVLMEVPRSDIATFFGVSESRISQIINDDEEYKLALQRATVDYHNKYQNIRDGWDGVEAFAVASLVETLAHDHDPEFALKAAAVANKATRRGGPKSDTLLNPNTGNHVVLNLTNRIIEQIQQINVTPDRLSKAVDHEVLESGVTKIHNTANPKYIKETLGHSEDETTNEELHRLMADMPDVLDDSS